MIVLIVGPSGVGKSETYKAARTRFTNSVMNDLDGMVATWAYEQSMIERRSINLFRKTLNGDDERFLAAGIARIKELANAQPSKHLVLDVGAGFQDAPSAIRLHADYAVVALTATPEVAHQRITAARNDTRTFQQYTNSEYNAHRLAVYASAHKSIDTTHQSQKQTLKEFVGVVGQLLSDTPAN